MKEGEEIDEASRALSNVGMLTRVIAIIGFLVLFSCVQKATAAVINLSPAEQTTLSNISETWSWENDQVGPWFYLAQIGTTVGGYDIYESVEFTDEEFTVDTLPDDSSELYLTLWSKHVSSQTWQQNTFSYTSWDGFTVTDYELEHVVATIKEYGDAMIAIFLVLGSTISFYSGWRVGQFLI